MIIKNEELEKYKNEKLSQRQLSWCLTNNIGSFASSSITGINSSKYNGLLVAALNPPIGRHLILSKIIEYIDFKNTNTQVCIASDKTKDMEIDNTKYLKEFEYNNYPIYKYEVDNVEIQKRVVLVNRENTVCIEYTVNNKSNSDITLELLPLVNYRDYHNNSKKGCFDFTTKIQDDKIEINLGNVEGNNSRLHNLFIELSESSEFKPMDSVFTNMYYDNEAERGLNPLDDHYIPGRFNLNVNKGCYKVVTMVCSLKPINMHNYLNIFEKEDKKVQEYIDKLPFKTEELKRLGIIASKFVVTDKEKTFSTIIAGYPHFSDWGRDTFISFEGLLLIPGRLEEAKSLLLRFASLVKDGIVPNTFNDSTSNILYNTVDSSLWFIEAVYKYLEYSLDRETVIEKLYPVVKNIIYSYMDGTVFNIKMDKDFLLTAGDETTQLTWMDAKVNNEVITPRNGKAVEINALWYNALRIGAYLAKQIDEEYDYLYIISNKCMDSFARKFYIEEKGYLYDTIEPYSDKLRPNQIFAVSLSYPVLEGKKAKAVVDKVFKELYTPYGLRTLSKDDIDYKGVYIGDVYQRDSCYHQGIVWPYLIGHFIKAYLKVNNNSSGSKKLALNLIRNLIEELDKNCIDGIAEIYDGDEPHIARGCFNQAWSIAELLRAAYWCLEI